MTEWLALGISSGVVGGVYTYYKYYRGQKELTAGYLKAAKKEKRVLNAGMDELIKIKDKALMLVGSFGGEDRSYAGRTLEMALKVHGLMEENFRRSAELVERVEEVEGIIAKDGDKVLSKADAEKVEWICNAQSSRYQRFDKIKVLGVEDRAELKTGLEYLEKVLETLWVELDEQDKRFKEILLRQIELTKRSRSGRFQLKGLSRAWASETEVMLDNAFSISKSDPVRVEQSLLVHMKQRFDKAEAALDVAEKLIRIETREVKDLRARMDAENLEELWVDDELDEMDGGLRDLVGYSDSVEEIERLIGCGGFKKRLNEMDFLMKKYEAHHRHLDEKFDRSLSKVRRQIAGHLGVDEESVLRDSDELNHCKLEAREVLSELGVAIAKGKVERSRGLHDLMKDKLAAAHEALATARRSAIDGEERLEVLRAGLEHVGKALSQAMDKHWTLLASVSDEVFDEEYLDVVKGAELQLSVLDAQLDLIERYRTEGKFIVTEKIMNSAEVTLDELNQIPDRVADSQSEVRKIERNIAKMLEKVDVGMNDLLFKKGDSYLCKDTRAMIDSLIGSYASMLELNKAAGKGRDVLGIMEGCHQLDDMLEMVGIGVESDVAMFLVLKQKVKLIDELVEESRSNANKAATDGIPDSELTTQMLEKVEFLTGRWPKLKSRMEGHQLEWREVRFDFDVFLQGLEVVNLQLEDELEYAQLTLDTLEEASSALSKLSAWQGERGYRAETRRANQILHQAFLKLADGKYHGAVQLAQETRDEMRDSLHQARTKERVAELRNARIQSLVIGSERAGVHRLMEPNPIEARRGVEF
ncbi:MAG: hypothetical protein ACSHX6_00480 [Akkermansiaceae bacterium]